MKQPSTMLFSICLLGAFAMVARTPVAAQVTPEKTVRVSAGVMAGMVLTKQTPVYPVDAKAAGIQGTVVLSATITKTGTVENIQVVSGPEKLRDAATSAVGNWRYMPYQLNGAPVAVSTMITINFSLDDQSKAGGGAVADAALESNPQPTPIATPQPTAAPVRVSSAVMAGLLLRRGAPEGSNLAKAAKEGGIVVLRAIISKTGTVSDLQVISGPMILRAPVLNSVKQWIYRPYLLNGQPVDVETQIVVKYSPLTGAQ